MIPSIVRNVVLAGSVVVATQVDAQQFAAFAQSQQGRDSVRVLARARTAQAGFERFRYHRLPTTLQGGRNGDCDEIVGRICFWFDDDPDPEPPPPEVPAIGERRRVLLNHLARAAEALPGDGWITGQRVRYLLEAGDEDQALAVARGCGAERWFCSALQGLALHESRRFGDAHEAFAAALAAMPAEERARWTDVSELLSPEDQRVLRRASEEERAAWTRRLWWLADPLWSEAGNDRLTEHFARWTMHHIQQHARQVERMVWRDDMRELLVRYGWDTAWERRVPMFYGYSGETVISYSDPRTWEWLVPLSVAREPHALRGDEWPLAEGEFTSSRYAPEYVARVVSLPHQLAVFPRPEGAVLVAGYALHPDSIPSMPRIRAAAVAMADADGPRSVSSWQPTAASGALMLDLTARSSIVSLEVREDSTRLLARQRQAVTWDADARVSDLLLLAHPEARPESLEDAARIARGSAEVRAGESVGVFWEMYGLPAGDSVAVRLALLAPRAGWARRQLEAAGIARGARPVRIGWREPADGEAIAVRSLAVGIPAGLGPGDYVLELTVTAPGRPAAVARRTVTVVEGP